MAAPGGAVQGSILESFRVYLSRDRQEGEKEHCEGSGVDSIQYMVISELQECGGQHFQSYISCAQDFDRKYFCQAFPIGCRQNLFWFSFLKTSKQVQQDKA